LQDEKSEDVWFYNNVNARKTTELYNETWFKMANFKLLVLYNN
jgi:hypothetical protein